MTKIRKEEEKFFPVVSISKDDLRIAFKGDKKAQKIIEKMTDSDMGYLANKMADGLFEGGGYWEVLKDTFRYRFMDKY